MFQVIVEGESLSPQSSEPRVAQLAERAGAAPLRYLDAHLYTLTCKRVTLCIIMQYFSFF